LPKNGGEVIGRHGGPTITQSHDRVRLQQRPAASRKCQVRAFGTPFPGRGKRRV